MIIITGGAGFIGSAMLLELNRKGEENIIIVDDLGSTTTEKWRNLSGLNFTDFIPKDLFPGLLDRNALKGISAIIHMGANSATTETDADHLLTNNFGYSKKIAEFSAAHEVRLLYASSAATYGDGQRGYNDETEGLNVLRPLNMYGYSKHLFDRWALKNHILDKAVGLKFFNVYGPNEYHKGDMSSVVYKAFHQILEKGSLNLFKSHRPDYGDGEQLRDFVYVKDCTGIMAWMLENPSVAGIFLPGDLGQLAVAALWESLRIADFKVQLPKGPTQTVAGNLYTFSGYLAENPLPDIQWDKVVTIKMKIQLASDITLTAGS